MFGLPKLGAGDVDGDNQTGPGCGNTDLIPDTQGFSVYGAQRTFGGLPYAVFRFRIGEDANSVESWHILLDMDNKFGTGTGPSNDPDATDANPGFELDITLIKRNNPGVFLTNVNGLATCPDNTGHYYPLTTNFQIVLADVTASCGDPNTYFYDIYV